MRRATQGGRLFALTLLLLLTAHASAPAQVPQNPAPTPSPSASVLMNSADADGMTFEQIFELAARDNLQLNAVRARRAVAESGVQIAGQRPNPDFITGYTRSEPRLNLSISQPVELGGKRARRLDVARGEVRLAELDEETALRTLRRDARAAYFNLALARDTLGLGRQTIEGAEQLATIAQARFEAGDIAQFEVLQARLAVARATNDLSRLENGERIARAALNALLNRAPDAPLALRESLFIVPAPLSLPELIARALAQNVELRTAEQQLATERSRLRLA
ncbi:MAG: TolC family protein, partial [Pyrinomonadaceae bacterium]